jgi:7-cyano-7-deazaguanine synthase
MPETILTVLFSSGLDSAVMLARAVANGEDVQPVYVSVGLAWESAEQAIASRFVASLKIGREMKVLSVDMTDVYPDSHWAIRGKAPGFDTPDSDVYLEGRNLILLSKSGVFMARIGSARVQIGLLSGNPFPDSSREFFDAMERALSIGLAHTISIEAPLASLTKADVIRIGAALGVRFELTMSCMQPVNGRHCGHCSKCRERRDAFRDAGVKDPTQYATPPRR